MLLQSDEPGDSGGVAGRICHHNLSLPFWHMGLYLGFNGIIYKMDLDEVIKKTPLERILVETDCPYLAPPEASTDRNEPIFVKHIAQRIADLRNERFDKIAQITTQNAKKLFKLT